MAVAHWTFRHDAALLQLRTLRRVQSWTLAVVAVASLAGGLAMIVARGEADAIALLHAVGWQFAIWGLIDLAFAATGIGQSLQADRRSPTPQAEADEFLAGEKLLRTLRFNHKLNVGYVVLAGLLLVWAAAAHNPAIAGHGVGVLLQGGFLLLFDRYHAARLNRLMLAPV